MKKNILFIINPKSGTSNKKDFPTLIHKNLAHFFDVQIAFTQYAQHATEIARQAAQQNADIVVAVGGDGTVNEVAKGLLHTQTALAILPTGSGNGLARHLGFPLDVQKNLKHLLTCQNVQIDACTVNEMPFFCTSGMGFDAKISYEFSLQSQRGFLTYAKTSVKNFWEFHPQKYELSLAKNHRQVEAFMLTIANANQFGNDAFIAPNADSSDGLMDICIVKPLNFWTSLRFNKDLFLKTLSQNPDYESFRTTQILIKREKADVIHFDGEPYQMPADLEYKILPKSLWVWK